ncbi:MAG: hypothetical protein ACTSQF_07210 [Candidatus Heimdallarchaeaceae archaeon]
MTTPENDNIQDSVGLTEEEEKRAENTAKLFQIGKYSILAALTILWIVSAVLGLISLLRGEGIVDTPWVIFGLVLTVVIVVLVVVPLFRSLRTDVKSFNEGKAEKEKIDKYVDTVAEEMEKAKAELENELNEVEDKKEPEE